MGLLTKADEDSYLAYKIGFHSTHVFLDQEIDVYYPSFGADTPTTITA